MAAPALHGDAPRRACEDLALDTNRFMEELRQEVLALMTESIKRSASFCASLCAERVVAARRELQLRMAEERQELELRYSLPADAARDEAAAKRAQDPAAAPPAGGGAGGGAAAGAAPGDLAEGARGRGAAPRWRPAAAAPSPRRPPPRDERGPPGGQAAPRRPAAPPADWGPAVPSAARGAGSCAVLAGAGQQAQALEENTSRLALAFQAMESLERTLQAEGGCGAPGGPSPGGGPAGDDGPPARLAAAASPRPSRGGRVPSAPLARAPPGAGWLQEAWRSDWPSAPASARASARASPSVHQPRVVGGAGRASGEATASARAVLPLPADAPHVGT